MTGTAPTNSQLSRTLDTGQVRCSGWSFAGRATEKHKVVSEFCGRSFRIVAVRYTGPAISVNRHREVLQTFFASHSVPAGFPTSVPHSGQRSGLARRSLPHTRHSPGSRCRRQLRSHIKTGMPVNRQRNHCGTETSKVVGHRNAQEQQDCGHDRLTLNGQHRAATLMALLRRRGP